MLSTKRAAMVAGLMVSVLALWFAQPSDPAPQPLSPPAIVPIAPVSISPVPTVDDTDVKPIPNFVHSGLAWLAEAQFPNGGWGAGKHNAQHIRDPRAVQIDPATTAFAAMAFMRAGSTLESGLYHQNVSRALNYLLELVENAPAEGTRISTVTGTQPHAKLGQQIDESMVAQFLTKVLPLTEGNPALRNRVQASLTKCLNKLSKAQDADGSWNGAGGWAGVLQSAMANNALEMASEAGLEVDQDALERSRAYQRRNVDTETGEVRTDAAAGISLYAVSSSQRAAAKEARKAKDALSEGIQQGIAAPSAAPSEELFEDLGYEREEAQRMVEAYRQNEVAQEMLSQDAVLQGFGNNGGEEFLSFMMTSEAQVVAGGEAWDTWHAKMNNLLSSIQNPDGSWSGHHCITSPVFCTVAVIMTMTADRDTALRAQQVSQSNG